MQPSVSVCASTSLCPGLCLFQHGLRLLKSHINPLILVRHSSRFEQPFCPHSCCSPLGFEPGQGLRHQLLQLFFAIYFHSTLSITLVRSVLVVLFSFNTLSISSNGEINHFCTWISFFIVLYLIAKNIHSSQRQQLLFCQTSNQELTNTLWWPSSLLNMFHVCVALCGIHADSRTARDYCQSNWLFQAWFDTSLLSDPHNSLLSSLTERREDWHKTFASSHREKSHPSFFLSVQSHQIKWCICIKRGTQPTHMQRYRPVLILQTLLQTKISWELN